VTDDVDDWNEWVDWLSSLPAGVNLFDPDLVWTDRPAVAWAESDD
jgi:hypothetical protein